MILAHLVIGLLCQDEPRIERALRVGEATFLFQTTLRGTAQFIESDRGAGNVLWAGSGFTAADVPSGAAWVRISGAEGTTAEFALEGAPQVKVEPSLPDARLIPARAGFDVDNESQSPLVVLIRRFDPEPNFPKSFVAAYFVAPASKRSLEAPGGSSALAVRVQDGAAVSVPQPAEKVSEREITGAVDSPEDFDITAVSGRIFGLYGRDLKLRVPDLREDVGGIFARLEYEDLDFRAAGLGLEFDLDLARVSLDAFKGEWDGDGTLTVDDGVTVTESPSSLEGKFYGARVGLYWPALRYRAEAIELAAGAGGGFLWIRQELAEADGEPFELEDTRSVVAGSAGPRVSILFRLGRGELWAEGGVEYLFGDLEGVGGQVSLGLGLRF